MTAREIQHLYWRAGFGISPNALKALKSSTRHSIVSDLFKKSENLIPLEVDLTEYETFFKMSYKKFKELYSPEEAQKLQQKSNKLVRDLNIKWVKRLYDNETLLREKMTLFWANVFVCRDNHILHMQQYNNTLREHALGNFGDFTKAIARQASMCKYLNNKQNIKSNPNENFARELMELFTLGIGNYSETDIKEAARAFTGWNFKRDGSFFIRKYQHDEGIKSFFSETGNFDGDDIIDIILKQKSCARYICSKIYTYFINPEINPTYLDEITDVFYKDYDIKKLMYYIFTTDWFYDPKNIGVKIKSPIELLAGIYQVVPFKFEKERQHMMYLQRIMGQTLLYPPNVAGWKGNQSWIDSNTLMVRLKLSAIILNNYVINLDTKGAFEDSFEEYYKTTKDRKKFINTSKNIEAFEFNYEALDYKSIIDHLLLSRIDDDTFNLINELNPESKLDFCVQLMSLPEYQLC